MQTQHLRETLARLRRGPRPAWTGEVTRSRWTVEALARGRAHVGRAPQPGSSGSPTVRSPYGYLMTAAQSSVRMALAAPVGDLSVTEVCFAVGCSSLGTFSTPLHPIWSVCRPAPTGARTTQADGWGWGGAGMPSWAKTG